LQSLTNYESIIVEKEVIMKIKVNEKLVDVATVELDGIDRKDSPDFSDAYVSYAEFEDGTKLSIEEMDMISDDDVYALVERHLY
jgi:hypothetical protein